LQKRIVISFALQLHALPVVKHLCSVPLSSHLRISSLGAAIKGATSFSSQEKHQKFGKPRHIGDRQKACDETSQTITFN
jgi:hypothetical protein